MRLSLPSIARAAPAAVMAAAAAALGVLGVSVIGRGDAPGFVMGVLALVLLGPTAGAAALTLGRPRVALALAGLPLAAGGMLLLMSG